MSTSTAEKLPRDVAFTYDDYLLLPNDGKRYQIVEGELYVSPAPGVVHQEVLARFLEILRAFAREHHLGRVLPAPCDVVLSKTTVVQPDILFVTAVRENIITTKNIRGAPDLVIEVVSPDSRRLDTQIKRKLYARFGVREYWLVDPSKKQVLQLVQAQAGFHQRGRFGVDDVLRSDLFPGLEISLKELFA